MTLARGWERKARIGRWCLEQSFKARCFGLVGPHWDREFADVRDGLRSLKKREPNAWLRGFLRENPADFGLSCSGFWETCEEKGSDDPRLSCSTLVDDPSLL